MADTTLSIHKIICPTDFSDFAASAFAESVRLARWFGAKVTVLHVMPFAVPVVGDRGYIPVSVANNEAARQARRADLQHFVDATEHTGVPVDTALREGDSCVEIREAIRETGADLIVMGTHGHKGFKRLALGSVTEAVLRNAPVPVLTVHRDLARPKGFFRRIVCATDVSDQTARTIAVATALADEGAWHLTVLNVIEDGRESMGSDLERTALDALWRLIPDEGRASYRIERHVAFGQADQEILKLAAKEDADLVVMGTHHHAGLGGLFRSTACGVVRDARCPVLLVPTGHAWPVTGITTTQNAEPVGAYRSTKGDRP
jgi:nucleotide-binding universal stress UspA family protein